MDSQQTPTFIDVGTGDNRRRIAVLADEGRAPAVIWLGGFKSDMRGSKAEALAAWAREQGRAFVRFDYMGHGESDGAFADATISIWLEDALALMAAHGGSRPVLIGSSMGGWIALLAARLLAKSAPNAAPGGLVLIAPAVDFTEALMWPRLPEDVRRIIAEEGVWGMPSIYSPEPTPITRALLEDGRRHLMLGSPIAAGCPVHILQGMKDPDVPWSHAMTLVEHLISDPVSITLVKDADHRLSTPEDIARLIAAVEMLVA